MTTIHDLGEQLSSLRQRRSDLADQQATTQEALDQAREGVAMGKRGAMNRATEAQAQLTTLQAAIKTLDHKIAPLDRQYQEALEDHEYAERQAEAEKLGQEGLEHYNQILAWCDEMTDLLQRPLAQLQSHFEGLAQCRVRLDALNAPIEDTEAERVVALRWDHVIRGDLPAHPLWPTTEETPGTVLRAYLIRTFGRREAQRQAEQDRASQRRREDNAVNTQRFREADRVRKEAEQERRRAKDAELKRQEEENLTPHWWRTTPPDQVKMTYPRQTSGVAEGDLVGDTFSLQEDDQFDTTDTPPLVVIED